MSEVAFITGGGRGIGRSVALRLAGDGYRVALVARTADEVDATVTEIREQGGEARGAACDVRSCAAVRAAVDEIATSWGAIDVLVNNAGRGGGGRTATLDVELWHDIIATNVHGVYFTTKAVLNEGCMGEGGRIVSVASTGGKQGVVFAAAYSASKHAVVGFTKSLALELASQGITVNAVCPGFVETSLAVRARDGYARIWNVSHEEAKRRIEQRVPIGRYIEPDEVADMVAYLASPRARGITGQTVNVCGGLGNY
jgi:ketoreductase